MDDNSQDAVDFKPFFDMVVGVLFILLILVAAQMFFAQWRPDTLAATAAEQERQRREELDRETQGFLSRLSQRLSEAGLPAGVDRVASSVVLEAGPLRSASGDWSGRSLAALGEALRAETSCLGQGLPPESGCPTYRQLRLVRLESIVGLAVSGPDPTPPPQARVRALDLAAGLFRQTPDLLSLRSPAGAPAIETTPRIAAGPDGQLELRFGFAEPR